MASFVAEGGPELERKARDDYKDNSVFAWVLRPVQHSVTAARLPRSHPLFPTWSPRFLFDKGSMEHLYFKKKVAEMRKDLLRPENTPDNGRFALCQIGVFAETGGRRTGVAFMAEAERRAQLSSPSRVNVYR